MWWGLPGSTYDQHFELLISRLSCITRLGRLSLGSVKLVHRNLSAAGYSGLGKVLVESAGVEVFLGVGLVVAFTSSVFFVSMLFSSCRCNLARLISFRSGHMLSPWSLLYGCLCG